MKRLLVHAIAASIVCLLLVSASSPARAEVDINFILANKVLDSDDWPGADTQGEFGIQTTFGPNDWPVGIAIDFLGTATTRDVLPNDPPGDWNLTQGTYELATGVREIWKPGSGKARPYVGGGVAAVGAGAELILGSVTISESGQGPGLWVDGGVFWRLGKRFNIGVESRISRAEVTIANEDVQAGGFHLGMTLGWGWGGDK